MRLPAFQRLSKEQDLINSLPIEGSYLVVGPPGTGKTVIALYRAQMMEKKNLATQIITYSKVLSTYIRSGSAAESIALDSTTYHKWVWDTYRSLYGLYPPQPPGRAGAYKFDWDRIIARLATSPPQAGTIPAVIVDEGQDMPAKFFQVAGYLGRNMTIFADENQRITEEQCTINEIRISSGILKNQIYQLRKNYRNTREIALLAAEYYVGLESGIAEIPTRSGPPIVFENHKIDRTTAFMINRYHQQNPKAEIGVLLPTKRQVKRFVNVLKNMLKDPTQLHWYYRDSDKPVGEPKFDMPGINVLTHASSKGLEFDAVFLPELQALPHSDPTEASVRMKLYVLFSRARDRLFISYTGEKTPIIEDIESALRRNGLLDKQEPDF